MKLSLPPIRPARPTWTDGTPASVQYHDHYFSAGQGMAESEQVFIQANRLPERFTRLDNDGLFVIGETGFGTGLNCLLAARSFRQHAPEQARLHLISTELHPLGRDDLGRSLAAWPELSEWSERLLAAYPPPAPGAHAIVLGDGVTLTLMLGDALTLLQHHDLQADAWFLDGFAPARNPAMWQPPLLTTIAERSRPGATLGTFTAAGAVRRGLADAGFIVERQPGFGRKRHRLTGQMPGTWTPARFRRGLALVAGSGPAGATTARALAERGWQVTIVDPVFDADVPVPAHLAGVLYATASAHLHAQNRFYQSALIRACDWLRRLRFPAHESHGRLEGVIQHLNDPRLQSKTLAAVEQEAWPQEMLRQVNEHSVCFSNGGYLHPPAWIRHLLDHPAIDCLPGRVEMMDGSGTMRLSDGRLLEGDAIVLCTASATARLPGLGWLPLRTVRGQVTFCRATASSADWRTPHCHSGYLTPALEGVHCVGATFDRLRSEPVIDPADDQTNLEELARGLPGHWAELGGHDIEVVGQLAGLRCQSVDTLPLVGPMPDATCQPHRLEPRIWLNIAHGSRGLTHTPLCADLLADQLSALPSSVDSSIIDTLAPERFVLRNRRRDPDWRP
ncbi:bifunctional tRNA (5-methylaminomethyl-2-thiouridine)(34)-methyltransferase MnmD/FAD-dependent 5-carboxymethylaminomethyl-2-thiouridine(34) oxidoreductase MnmC [Wenzhouxiangella sp. AB-CW3]|uniref:bifunctional tRNA (5-methylaminomethyl-2-thiouridine)(34)-methyltransferase MnmD/FAD-dependent 5-carboxymethylaminomethyl-2-thiouridine(34) oxidoreductase MnmC n=1 Tax=Wenzhouxiangella sp. AB-CW3 TaxID=2771012 RepID=UPI00168B1BC6|nr:bifunctional tRNA (5-methylaminomethyl-2-thiouridine)(34)-methyltransferase MnmD/FAD-dependent 5-carboxymethylaminomethyl-2-thiouridine(34) oxidoreductase MnmC [Wenzhouxiangella sp. AB-CW3]QOC22946.1 bifunctional tRNA (5-methylaminomethyl-2-thiouridine)(34)-methyltransferase MnmD/FAD-dependent 5-carboxymethylaminomethyl-2-thiouridine(34) oxidoreductase MnmC [Wenzhouxiangella sp. AB-CW3]